MINRKVFFDHVRQSPFPKKLNQKQVEGCGTILDECERWGIIANASAKSEIAQASYILATAFWETDNTMQPIKEGGGIKYLKSKKYYPWYGRGYVQLTWEANYKKYRGIVQQKFGVDIIISPDQAMLTDVACYILFDGMRMGKFTGKALADYFNTKTIDYVGARRIINGTDKAREIAGIAMQFNSALSASMEG